MVTAHADKLSLTVNGQTRSVTTADNPATAALISLLKTGPITITMSDYGGFEKVGPLPCSLPSADTHISTSPGDIMLYQGNQMVIFYGTNSWSYTPLGKIDNATSTNVKEFLGKGTIEVTLSLTDTSAIEEIEINPATSERVYDLTGRLITRRPLSPGCYIINGKKVAIH